RHDEAHGLGRICGLAERNRCRNDQQRGGERAREMHKRAFHHSSSNGLLIDLRARRLDDARVFRELASYERAELLRCHRRGLGTTRRTGLVGYAAWPSATGAATTNSAAASARAKCTSGHFIILPPMAF